LEEIDSVDRLVNSLEKIELPNQLISILADPLLQKLMLLRPDANAEERIANWLNSYTEDLVRGETTTLAELTNFLEVIREYASSARNERVPPAVLSFFASYLKIWDGKIAKQCILDILSYASIPVNGFLGKGAL
jgi:centromere protein I